MPGRPASSRRRLLDFVALDVETNQPVFDSRSEALRDFSTRDKPSPSGSQEGSGGEGRRGGRHLQQDAAVESTTPPFTNLIHGVGAFMAPVRELVSAASRNAGYLNATGACNLRLSAPEGGFCGDGNSWILSSVREASGLLGRLRIPGRVLPQRAGIHASPSDIQNCSV